MADVPVVPIARGTIIGNFAVRRFIARGGMGEVYAARDERLGRRVALKLVRADVVDDIEVAAFLREARITAQFNHPHIVTVYDVGVHEGRPWLALEFLEGESLKERAAGARLAVPEVLRIAHQIALALAEAHRHGVLHRDLKPANVLVGKDGRVRVVDFGIATQKPSELAGNTIGDDDDDVAPVETSALGTARYMSPEQWLAEGLTTAVDVWALGVILHELLTGAHPFLGAQVPVASIYREVMRKRLAPLDVADPRIAELVAGCLEKKGSARLTADDVAERTERILAGSAQATVSEAEGPFPGLVAYREDHAAVFFGRDAEVAGLVERLREAPFVVVTGPSGSGKSSLVLAGAIPRLKEAGRCTVLTLRPGRAPFLALARRLNSVDGHSGPLHSDAEAGSRGSGPLRAAQETNDVAADDERLAAELMARPASLHAMLRERARANGGQVVVFVNQLEELFTLNEPDVQRRFLQALTLAADDAEAPVRVIVTLRDDFLGRYAEVVDDVTALQQVMSLAPLGRDQLARVLTSAPARVGYSWDEPLVVAEMIQEVADAPAPLPLLQFVCALLWESRDRARHVLVAARYRAMGGVKGALAGHADGILNTMSTREVAIARSVLLRLVTADGLSRAQARDELVSGLPAGVDDVVRQLVRGRLLIARRKSGARADAGRDLASGAEQAEIEIAHEALVRSWSRLSRWVDDARGELRLVNELAEAAALWDRRGRPIDQLWRGRNLAEIEEVLVTSSIEPPALALALINASRAADQTAKRRSLIKRAAAVVVVVVVVVASLSAAALFRESEHRARAARDEALHRQSEALRAGAVAAGERGDVFEARARLRSALEIEDSVEGRALWWRFQKDRLVDAVDVGTSVNALALDATGDRMATGTATGNVVVVDRRTRATRVLEDHIDQVKNVAWLAGDRIGSLTWSGELRIWDAGADGHGHNVVVSTRAKSMSAGDDGALVWVENSGTPEVRLGRLAFGAGPVDVTSARMTPLAVDFGRVVQRGGVTIGAGKSGLFVLEAPADRGGPRRLEDKAMSGAHLSGDGHVVVGVVGSVVVVHDLVTGTRTPLRGHSGLVSGAAVDDAGKRVVTTSRDGFVRVFAVEGGLLERRRVGSVAVGASITPDGRFVGAASLEGRLALLDLRARPDLAPSGHERAISAVAVNPRGEMLASGSVDRTIRLASIDDGRELGVIDTGEAVWSLAFSPDGALVAAGGDRGGLGLFDVVEGVALRRLAGHRDSVNSVLFSDDGLTLFSTGDDAAVRAWDVTTGRQLTETLEPAGLMKATLLDDGRLAIPAFNGKVFVQDKRGGLTAIGAHSGPAISAAATAGGFVSVGMDSTLRQFSNDGTAGVVVALPGGATMVDVGADPRRAIVATSKGLVLVNLDDQSVRSIGAEHPVGAALWSVDQRQVFSNIEGNAVVAVDVVTGENDWRAPLLRAGQPELCGSSGCRTVGAAGPGTLLPATAWRTAVTTTARRAHDDGDHLCLLTFAGQIERWSIAADKREWSQPASSSSSCLSLAVRGAACVVRTNDGIALVSATGTAPMAGTAGASAFAVDDDDGSLFVALPTEVLHMNVDGSVRERWPGAHVSALWPTPKGLVLGHVDGSLRRGGVSFDRAPPVAVTALAAGPRTAGVSTVVAGFADGRWGLWDVVKGSQLAVGRVRGDVTHVGLRTIAGASEPSLLISSALGDVRVVDVATLLAPTCTALSTLWSEAPFAWGEGEPVRAAPPVDHPCASAAQKKAATTTTTK
ncbi:MAG: protein kinase [Deltaproteobacteria bacterium]|nr:protein kinase [Deltaproteobacteria bacterium]